jgi:hypothetical protein
MPRLIVTAEVEDGVKWEEGFRTHLDLFREMTVTATHFAVTDGNEVALYEETVKVFVLDKQLAL